MAEKAGKPLFDTMIEQNLLKTNVFSFFLSYNTEESEILFGGYSEDKFIGELQYHDVKD